MILLGIITLLFGVVVFLLGLIAVVDDEVSMGAVLIFLGIALFALGISAVTDTPEVPELHKAYIVSSHAKPDTLGVITSESSINIELLRNDWRVEHE